jgi:hypothetical protein
LHLRYCPGGRRAPEGGEFVEQEIKNIVLHIFKKHWNSHGLYLKSLLSEKNDYDI